ncbi:hypothetical protein [Persephonella sp. IF05-L8]|uniref:hypothetical protein n=1 Tax=Persephonella sp. IF05-L8 TaxID=1158338 RepID=UPI0004973F06
MIYWIEFLILVVIIFFAGKNLVKYGDILAEKLNIGRSIIGLIFIASVTSLPELITGISAAAYVQSPDLVAGEIFGSCMANLFLLAILDAFVRDQPLTTKVHHGFTLSSAFGIMLITFAGISLLLDDIIPSIGWISVSSFVIILIYIIALKITTDYERRLIKIAVREVAEELQYEKVQLKEVIIKSIFFSILIIIAAIFLPDVGHKITEIFGLSETFFGSLFIAISTSLPELAVSIAAIRLNLVQIAVANLLGSNIFNVFILPIADIFYMKGSIFADMNSINLLPASFSVLMTSIVIAGLIYKAEKKLLPLAYETIILIFIYIIGIYIIFVASY